jgi:2-oxoglutarate ferredoxin oxidoreductase subunit beta
MVNNNIYGMTGGQTAPTTPMGIRTITSPFGNMEPNFDVAPLVAAAGGSYVARWTTYHPRQLRKTIKKGITKNGFAFIEAVSQCPVQFGRASGLGKAVDILDFFKETSLKITNTKDLTDDDLAGKILVGEFADSEKPELTAQWHELHRKIKETTK